MYFNDNTYIGWIPNSDVLEIMSNDPKLGAIFYTMKQKPLEEPVIIRNDHDCLDCHSSARTQSVPGGMLKSRFINLEGSLMSTVVNHRTPINKRWGSWYVTGNSPADHHLGNLRKADEDLDNINITDLSALFATKQYLTDSSDIVALMVMEHQIHMTNLITRAAYRTRIILDKRNLDENATENIDKDDLEDISRQLTPLLDYMLFVDEAHINAPIKGNTDYQSSFEATGPKTRDGKSLRKLDLNSRLFKYPLSYMIYSENFQQLPAIAKKITLKNLKEILAGKNQDKKYRHLTSDLRSEILKILNETLTGF
ncbi:MAG: hypothetical protein MK132_27525 [Lentisphaerales bacterium]|nr:hypothetical protein [Lentisphaerales bacterium]